MFPNFDLCMQLREGGFPQLRKYQAMYYVRPEMLICIDDLSALKNDGHTDFEDIFNSLVFKPRLEDIIENSPWLTECLRMADGTVFAYSNVQEDLEYIKEVGRGDPYIRSRGDTYWHAVASLYVAVRKRQEVTKENRTLDPKELESSENIRMSASTTNTHLQA